MQKLHLTKMQRKVRAKRKTWTKAERFEKRMKNERRLALLNASSLVQKLLHDAEAELNQTVPDVSPQKEEDQDTWLDEPLTPEEQAAVDECDEGT